MLRLFRFKPFPLPLNKEVALLPKVEADVLALSHGERFSQELKFADLMDCHVINKVYLCDKHGILRKALASSCLGALWNQKFDEANRLCGMQVQPHQEFILQLQNNWHLIWSPRAITAPVTCLNGSETDLHLRSGVNKQHLDETCKATLSDHVIIADTDHQLDGQIKHFEWQWQEDTYQQLTSDDVKQSIQFISETGQEKFSLTEVLQDRAAAKRSPGWTLFWVAIGIIVTIAAVAGITTVLGWRKYLKIRNFINDQIDHIRNRLESFFKKPIAPPLAKPEEEDDNETAL
jgi:hypothetical protein